MKQMLLVAATSILLTSGRLAAQCTPVNCLSSLPPYGGMCDTVLINGSVNSVYSDFESFHITTNCFDGGILSPSAAGVGVYITSVHTFTFTGLPTGLTGGSGQASYTSPANGCVYFTGTPVQAGVFDVHANFLADATAYPFGGGTCTGFSAATTNNAAYYSLDLTVLPDPSFTIPSDTVCTGSGVQNLTITGTAGGSFYGPGVSGTTFDPSVAGVGTHTIKYIVSAQEGTAVAAATDSSTLTVVVMAPGTFYVDGDNDTYGDAAATATMICSATAPAGYSVNNLDCNDANNAIHPGALEIPANSIDEDCDGLDAATDVDNDGFDNTVDCNDNDSTIYPGAPEICDGIDNDCDMLVDDSITFVTYYQDLDGDTYGNPSVSVSACNPVPGHVTNNTDCNDANAAIHPGATEVCDGVDNDCTGGIDNGLTFVTYYLDADGDTYGRPDSSISSCTTITGFVTNNTDCNDAASTIHPGATDALGNGIDENCDGVDGVLGIESMATTLNLNVYPNPASDMIMINGNLNANVQVRILNMSGSVVMQNNFAFANTHSLNVSEITPGFYILAITNVDSGQSGYMRLVITR